MAGHHSRLPAEHNAPCGIGRRAPQFAVHEVGAAPEEQPDRSPDATEVGQREVRNVREMRGDDSREQRADEPAVKAHAALREREDVGGMLQVVAVSVKQDVSQTPAYDNAHDNAQHDGDERIRVDAHPPALRRAHKHESGADKPEHVRDAVPSHRKRPDRERDRVEALIDFVEQGASPFPFQRPLRWRRSEPLRAGPKESSGPTRRTRRIGGM